MMGKPVKSFPELPTHFVMERTHIVTDGKSWLRKVDNPFAINNDKLNIEMGCEVRILRVKSSQVIIRHNGRAINIGITEDGTRTVDNEEDLEAPFNAKLPLVDTSNYSEKRTINGVRLRCLPKTDIAITSKLALDMCIYEKDGEIFEANKSPIILYHRVKPPIESASFQYLVVTQSSSFKILYHIDPSLLDPDP